MLNKFGIANVLAVTSGILWVICALFVVLLPELAYNITGWWLHGLDISPLGYWNITLGGLVMGGISLVLAGWVSGLVFGWAVELLNKK